MNKIYELDEIIVTSDLPELETEALCEHVEIRVFAKSDYGELDFPQLSEEVMDYIYAIKQSRVDEYNG